MDERRAVRERGRRIFALSMILSVGAHVALFALVSGRIPIPAEEGRPSASPAPDAREAERPAFEHALRIVNVRVRAASAAAPSASGSDGPGVHASRAAAARPASLRAAGAALPEVRAPAAALHLAAAELRATDLPLADAPARGVVLRRGGAAYPDDEIDFRPASEAARAAEGDRDDRGWGGPVIIRGGGGDCPRGGIGGVGGTDRDPFPGRIGGRVGGRGGTERRFP